MGPQLIEKRRRAIINFVYFLIIASMVYVCLKYWIYYVMPFLIGFSFAFLFKPLINLITGNTRLSRKTAAVAVMIMFYAILCVLLFFLGTKLFLFLKDAVDGLPEFYQICVEPALTTLLSWFESVLSSIAPDSLVLPPEQLADSLSDAITALSANALNLLSDVASGIPGFLVGLLVTIVSSFFFAADYYTVTSFLTRQLSERWRQLIFDVKAFLVGTVFKLGLSYFCIMLITFAELSIGLLILKIPNAIGVAAIIAVVDILPVLGTGAIVIPWSLLALLRQDYTLAAGLIILYAVITVIRNIIEPKIVGRQVGLHPLAALVCMIVGVRLFGGLGILLLPLLVIVVKNLNDTGKLRLFQ